MADAVWPITLPVAPLLKRYRETPPELVLRTQMDAGPAKARRRNTANVRRASFTFAFTHEQWEIFDAFFVTTIAGGALTFELARPATGNLADWRIVGTPEYEPITPRDEVSGKWLVSFEAELLPGTEVGGDAPDPPNPDEGLQLVLAGFGPTGTPAEISIEELESPFLMQDLTIWGAAPPAQDDYIVMIYGPDFTDPFMHTNEDPTIGGIGYPVSDSGASPEYGAGDIGFGGGPVDVSGVGMGIT